MEAVCGKQDAAGPIRDNGSKDRRREICLYSNNVQDRVPGISLCLLYTSAQRSAVLIELGEKHRRKYIREYKGKEAEVLIEEQIRYEGKKVWTGHTKEYMKIALEDDRNLQNCIIKVQIDNDLQIIH